MLNFTTCSYACRKEPCVVCTTETSEGFTCMGNFLCSERCALIRAAQPDSLFVLSSDDERVQATRAAEGLQAPRWRRESGFMLIRAWPVYPTKEALQHARDTAWQDFREHGWVQCPCCQTKYAISLEAADVRETGVCSQCYAYTKGNRQWVEKHVYPSFEEVMERVNAGYGLTPAEVTVFREKFGV
jgi:hypothetical protein